MRVPRANLSSRAPNSDCPGTAIPNLPKPFLLNKEEFLGRFKEEGIPEELMLEKVGGVLDVGDFVRAWQVLGAGPQAA